MKICIISIDSIPNIGGIAAHVHELSKALVKRGNEVHVITSKRDFSAPGFEEIDGVNIYRIFFPWKRSKIIKLLYLPVYIGFSCLRLRILIKSKRIEIVHSHNIPDAFIGISALEIPRVETEHSSWFLESIDNGKYVSFCKWLFNRSDFIIGPSKELTEYFIKIGIKPYKVCLISNGVDPNKFSCKEDIAALRRKYDVDPDEKIVLCPRRLEPKNGVIYLMESIPYIIEKYKAVKFLIVGDGSDMNRLEDYAAKMNISNRVIFAGRVQNSDMPAYYQVSDIVVLPSLREATSIAGLEAMASSKPLVGTNIGGIPEIITDGEQGILVPPRDPEMMAQAIFFLLNNDRERIRLGTNARHRIESDFSWDFISGKTIELYKKAIDKYHLL